MNDAPKNEVEWIRSLDEPAPQSAPDVNVASAVMRQIRVAQAASSELAFPPLAALIASLIGAVAAAVAVMAWMNVQDPMADFLQPLRMVLQ